MNTVLAPVTMSRTDGFAKDHLPSSGGQSEAPFDPFRARSRRWTTFVRNHATETQAWDFFAVGRMIRTALLVVRDLLHFVALTGSSSRPSTPERFLTVLITSTGLIRSRRDFLRSTAEPAARAAEQCDLWLSGQEDPQNLYTHQKWL